MAHLTIDGRTTRDLTAGELREWFLAMPSRVGMNRISPVVVEMAQDGLSAFTVIAESHISLHLYDSMQAAHFDLFTCRAMPPEVAATALVALRELGIEPLRIRLDPDRLNLPAMDTAQSALQGPAGGVVRNRAWPWQEGYRG